MFVMICFGVEIEDEVFIIYEVVMIGVDIYNMGSELLVGLRYFGLDIFVIVFDVGDYRE